MEISSFCFPYSNVHTLLLHRIFSKKNRINKFNRCVRSVKFEIIQAWIILFSFKMNHIFRYYPTISSKRCDLLSLSLFVYILASLPLFSHFHLQVDARSPPAAVSSCQRLFIIIIDLTFCSYLDLFPIINLDSSEMNFHQHFLLVHFLLHFHFQ